jgi:hypothetical protein
MRNGVTFAGIAFGIGMAYFIGSRLSNEAMAMIVGGICGISLSIPLSIAVMIANSRNWGQPEVLSHEIPPERKKRRRASQQPVIIMGAPSESTPRKRPQTQYLLPPGPSKRTRSRREFKIIGGD